jgi:aspartate aminotransferase-like enzyme
MLFQTSGPVLPLTCSGRGAMEAAAVNLFSPGETVITANGGKSGSAGRTWRERSGSAR